MTSQLNVKKIEGLTSGGGNDTVIIRTGNADRVTVTNTAVTMSGNQTVTGTMNVTGAVTLSNTVSTTGDFLSTGKEYFQVMLTTNQGSLADNTSNVVDFGGSGTVIYDTKSNVDTSNDAYELASSDGVYLISFSAAIRSPGVTTERLQDTAAFLEFSTDSFGSTLIGIDNQFGVATHMMDTNNDEEGSNTLSATFLYKVRFSNTKVRLKVYANTSGSANYTVAGNINSMLNGSPSDDTRCTALSVVRVA